MKRPCDCRVRNNNDKTPRSQNIEHVNVSQARLGKKAQFWNCTPSHQTESWKQLPENKNFRSSTVDVNEIGCRRHSGSIDWNSSPQRDALWTRKTTISFWVPLACTANCRNAMQNGLEEFSHQMMNESTRIPTCRDLITLWFCDENFLQHI